MADAAPAPAAQTPLKKGSLVRVNKAAYSGSLEANASDALPGYL
ncbi:MAG: NAD(P)H-quinone oxidoreductase subunit O, partial [Cyanobium sp. MAG_04]|nr:NAD(P)H-quinone oxidoreductase subunit O [Cyanobium sp. MAG_04]